MHVSSSCKHLCGYNIFSLVKRLYNFLTNAFYVVFSSWGEQREPFIAAIRADHFFSRNVCRMTEVVNELLYPVCPLAMRLLLIMSYTVRHFPANFGSSLVLLGTGGYWVTALRWLPRVLQRCTVLHKIAIMSSDHLMAALRQHCKAEWRQHCKASSSTNEGLAKGWWVLIAVAHVLSARIS